MITHDLIDSLCYINNCNYIQKANYFSPFSFKIRLTFDYATYCQSLKNYTEKGEVDKYLRIILHEHFHFFQTTYTSFGAYNYLLEQYNQALVINLLLYLVNKNINDIHIVPPIISIIKNNKQLWNDNKIIKYLFDIIDTNLMNSFINQPIDKYMEKWDVYSHIKPDYIQGGFVSKSFANLDYSLYSYLKSSNRGFDNYHKYQNVDVYYNKDELHLQEIQNLKIKINRFPTTRGILESYSTATELFLINNTIDMKFFNKIITPQEEDYYLPLQIASEHIPTKNTKEFLLTYMAVSEIILSPPILPHLCDLRGNYPNLTDFDLGYRFFCVLKYLPKIKPVHNDNEDYTRYINELCFMLDWPTPVKIAEHILLNFKIIENESVAKMFVGAQHDKIHSNNMFSLIDKFIYYLSEELAYCPITELKDEILINHETNDEVNFTMGYLMKQFLGYILTEDKACIYFPYEIKSQSSQTLYIRLFEKILNSLGLDIKNVKNYKIVNPYI